MSRRDDRVLLQDMIEAAEAACSEIEGLTREDFEGDHVRALGLTKCLEIIGEAASRISSGCQNRHCDLPWREMVGMRNRLVHAYFEIDYEQVWKALTEELPPLVLQLRRILDDQA